MDISMNMGPIDLAKTRAQVDSLNATLGKPAASNGKNILGKDDFLKLLMTQLTHQDPTQPMNDTQFIAQMAQFSSLEQMTNISQGFTKLNNLLASGQALGLLGKHVEIGQGKNAVTGVVEAISGQSNPQVKVNGTYYDYADIEKVME
ncbi:MAG TPA: flagellar hook assembly protein FlgD [Spirochaetia bacterium]|nr:flagellar hook assembly protein FlgD [Spirochaetia bacterium]